MVYLLSGTRFHLFGYEMKRGCLAKDEVGHTTIVKVVERADLRLHLLDSFTLILFVFLLAGPILACRKNR